MRIRRWEKWFLCLKPCKRLELRMWRSLPAEKVCGMAMLHAEKARGTETGPGKVHVMAMLHAEKAHGTETDPGKVHVMVMLRVVKAYGTGTGPGKVRAMATLHAGKESGMVTSRRKDLATIPMLRSPREVMRLQPILTLLFCAAGKERSLLPMIRIRVEGLAPKRLLTCVRQKCHELKSGHSKG